MQFKATALLAIVAIGSSPVFAAPMPLPSDGRIATPHKPVPKKDGKNALQRGAAKVNNAVTSCVLGAVLCAKIAADALKSGKTPTVYNPKRDVPVIGDIEARSLEPEGDYIHVVTRDTIDEEADETAEETAEEEADE